MNDQLIAPCGMNCAICSNYLALKNDVRAKGVKLPYCKGCRPRNKQCSFVKKKCSKLLKGSLTFCFECENFPCELLFKLSKGYEKYKINMVDNLYYIKQNGLEAFLEKEKKKWECPKCKKTICCHNGVCYFCNLQKMKTKKKRYQWED